MSEFCDCKETFLCEENGKINLRRVPKPPHHDCDYIRRRSALVYRAEREAYDEIGEDIFGVSWTRHFAAAMERLVRQEGLLRG